MVLLSCTALALLVYYRSKPAAPPPPPTSTGNGANGVGVSTFNTAGVGSGGAIEPWTGVDGLLGANGTVVEAGERCVVLLVVGSSGWVGGCFFLIFCALLKCVFLGGGWWGGGRYGCWMRHWPVTMLLCLSSFSWVQSRACLGLVLKRLHFCLPCFGRVAGTKHFPFVLEAEILNQRWWRRTSARSMVHKRATRVPAPPPPSLPVPPYHGTSPPISLIRERWKRQAGWGDIPFSDLEEWAPLGPDPQGIQSPSFSFSYCFCMAVTFDRL